MEKLLSILLKAKNWENAWERFIFLLENRFDKKSCTPLAKLSI
jgi:hypothetical protein